MMPPRFLEFTVWWALYEPTDPVLVIKAFTEHHTAEREATTSRPIKRAIKATRCHERQGNQTGGVSLGVLLCAHSRHGKLVLCGAVSGGGHELGSTIIYTHRRVIFILAPSKKVNRNLPKV